MTTDPEHAPTEVEARRVLFVAAECAPLAKVGGVADVVAALSRTLARQGLDVRLVLPLYAEVDRARHGVTPDGSCCVHMGGGVEHWIGVHAARLFGEVPLWLVDYGEYFGRAGIYGRGAAHQYEDNAHRFALLCRAALQLCRDRDFAPDVVHLHDWPTAPLAALLKTAEAEDSPLRRCASVLTIHNVGYQGKFPAAAFDYLGLAGALFDAESFEDFGQVNLLKGGVRFADAITTVSPTHREEILTPEGGHGLTPFLEQRAQDLFGIINGVDEQIWSPEHDPLLPECYSADELEGKAQCKAALQYRMGLDERPDLPLLGVISRLTREKGIELLVEALPRALEQLQLQLIVVGSGEGRYEQHLRWLANTYYGRVACHIGHSEELAHWVGGGADFLLMPSLYEPCGLNQIYAMRYGTLPVARATGGLKDTIVPYDEARGSGSGFLFEEPSPGALYEAIARAVTTWFERSAHIARMQQQAMAGRFSWAAPARRYREVYAHAMARRRT